MSIIILLLYLQETSFCITPLIIACGTGRTKMVELLVNKGADVNKQSMVCN